MFILLPSVVSDRARLLIVTCILTGDRRHARHFDLATQFCFLDADCLVVGDNQGSSRRSVGKCPVKSLCPKGDSQTIVYILMQEPLIVCIFFQIIDILLGFEPA